LIAQLSVQLGGAALEILRRATHGENRFTQLPDEGVRLLRRHGHLVGEVGQLIHGQAQRRHGVGGEVGGVSQIQTARLGKRQHLRQGRACLVRIVTRQRQVVQSGRRFRGGIAGRAAHLLSRAVQKGNLPIRFLRGACHKAHGGLHSFQAVVKGCKGLHAHRAQRHDGCGYFGGELLADLGYLFADRFQLCADVFQLCAQLIKAVLRQLQLPGDELQRLFGLGDLLLRLLQLGGQLFCLLGILAGLRLALFIGGFKIGHLLLLRSQFVRQGLGGCLELRRHLLKVGDPCAGIGAGGLQLCHLSLEFGHRAFKIGSVKGQADNQVGCA